MKKPRLGLTLSILLGFGNLLGYSEIRMENLASNNFFFNSQTKNQQFSQGPNGVLNIQLSPGINFMLPTASNAQTNGIQVFNFLDNNNNKSPGEEDTFNGVLGALKSNIKQWGFVESHLLEPKVNLTTPEIYVPLGHLTAALMMYANINMMRNDLEEARKSLEVACPLMELLPHEANVDTSLISTCFGVLVDAYQRLGLDNTLREESIRIIRQPYQHLRWDLVLKQFLTSPASEKLSLDDFLSVAKLHLIDFGEQSLEQICDILEGFYNESSEDSPVLSRIIEYLDFVYHALWQRNNKIQRGLDDAESEFEYSFGDSGEFPSQVLKLASSPSLSSSIGTIPGAMTEKNLVTSSDKNNVSSGDNEGMCTVPVFDTVLYQAMKVNIIRSNRLHQQLKLSNHAQSPYIAESSTSQSDTCSSPTVQSTSVPVTSIENIGVGQQKTNIHHQKQANAAAMFDTSTTAAVQTPRTAVTTVQANSTAVFVIIVFLVILILSISCMVYLQQQNLLRKKHRRLQKRSFSEQCQDIWDGVNDFYQSFDRKVFMESVIGYIYHFKYMLSNDLIPLLTRYWYVMVHFVAYVYTICVEKWNSQYGKGVPGVESPYETKKDDNNVIDKNKQHHMHSISQEVVTSKLYQGREGHGRDNKPKSMTDISLTPVLSIGGSNEHGEVVAGYRRRSKGSGGVATITSQSSDENVIVQSVASSDSSDVVPSHRQKGKDKDKDKSSNGPAVIISQNNISTEEFSFDDVTKARSSSGADSDLYPAVVAVPPVGDKVPSTTVAATVTAPISQTLSVNPIQLSERQDHSNAETLSSTIGVNDVCNAPPQPTRYIIEEVVEEEEEDIKIEEVSTIALMEIVKKDEAEIVKDSSITTATVTSTSTASNTSTTHLQNRISSDEGISAATTVESVLKRKSKSKNKAKSQSQVVVVDTASVAPIADVKASAHDTSTNASRYVAHDSSEEMSSLSSISADIPESLQLSVSSTPETLETNPSNVIADQAPASNSAPIAITVATPATTDIVSNSNPSSSSDKKDVKDTKSKKSKAVSTKPKSETRKSKSSDKVPSVITKDITSLENSDVAPLLLPPSPLETVPQHKVSTPPKVQAGEEFQLFLNSIPNSPLLPSSLLNESNVASTLSSVSSLFYGMGNSDSPSGGVLASLSSYGDKSPTSLLSQLNASSVVYEAPSASLLLPSSSLYHSASSTGGYNGSSVVGISSSLLSGIVGNGGNTLSLGTTTSPLTLSRGLQSVSPPPIFSSLDDPVYHQNWLSINNHHASGANSFKYSSSIQNKELLSYQGSSNESNNISVMPSLDNDGNKYTNNQRRNANAISNDFGSSSSSSSIHQGYSESESIFNSSRLSRPRFENGLPTSSASDSLFELSSSVSGAIGGRSQQSHNPYFRDSMSEGISMLPPQRQLQDIWGDVNSDDDIDFPKPKSNFMAKTSDSFSGYGVGVSHSQSGVSAPPGLGGYVTPSSTQMQSSANSFIPGASGNSSNGNNVPVGAPPGLGGASGRRGGMGGVMGGGSAHNSSSMNVGPVPIPGSTMVPRMPSAPVRPDMVTIAITAQCVLLNPHDTACVKIASQLFGQFRISGALPLKCSSSNPSLWNIKIDIPKTISVLKYKYIAYDLKHTVYVERGQHHVIDVASHLAKHNEDEIIQFDIFETGMRAVDDNMAAF